MPKKYFVKENLRKKCSLFYIEYYIIYYIFLLTFAKIPTDKSKYELIAGREMTRYQIV